MDEQTKESMIQGLGIALESVVNRHFEGMGFVFVLFDMVPHGSAGFVSNAGTEVVAAVLEQGAKQIKNNKAEFSEFDFTVH